MLTGKKKPYGISVLLKSIFNEKDTFIFDVLFFDTITKLAVDYKEIGLISNVYTFLSVEEIKQIQSRVYETEVNDETLFYAKYFLLIHCQIYVEDQKQFSFNLDVLEKFKKDVFSNFTLQFFDILIQPVYGKSNKFTINGPLLHSIFEKENDTLERAVKLLEIYDQWSHVSGAEEIKAFINKFTSGGRYPEGLDFNFKEFNPKTKNPPTS